MTDQPTTSPDALVQAARAALESLEGQSGAGAFEIYRFPAVLALHDVVFDPERLDETTRIAIRAEEGLLASCIIDKT